MNLLRRTMNRLHPTNSQPRNNPVPRGLPVAVLRTCVFATLVCSLWGCAYFQRLDLSEYPADSRTLFVHNFTNESFQPDVNVELAEFVRNAAGARENFFLRGSREEARLWLYGEITVYRKEGRMFDNLRTPTRYELLIACRIKLRENPGSELYLSRELSARTEYSHREGFVESEYQARRRVLQVLARNINAAIEAEYVNRRPAPARSAPADDSQTKSDL